MKALTGLIGKSALTLTLLAGVAACGSDAATPTPAKTEGGEVKSAKQRIVAPTVQEDDFAGQVAGNHDFAWDLYRQLAQEKGNLFYSPHSISMALAMLHAGARGATESELAAVMHYVLPQAKLHPAFNKLDQLLESRGQGAQASDGSGFRLNVVNAIWGQRDYSFLPSYLDTLAENYGAGLRVLDFTTEPEPARLAINAWVAEQTEERIKDLLAPGSITDATRLVLTNAIYFNAAWAVPFEESATKDGEFSLLDGGIKTTAMMKGQLKGAHAALTDFQAFDLPYDGHELSMVVVLPDAGKFATVEASLTRAIVEDTIAALRPADLQLTLPKFSFSASLAFAKTLQAMGLHDAFTPGTCDLSGIDGSHTLVVSDVLHKAFIRVNEAGTEAAAATAILVGGTSMPVPVVLTVDRPFIFLIRDRATGAVLFVGRVLDPTAA